MTIIYLSSLFVILFLTIKNSKHMSDLKQQLDEQFAKMNDHITNVANDLNAKLDEIAAAPTAEESAQLINDAKGIVDRLKAVDDLVPAEEQPEPEPQPEPQPEPEPEA